MLSTFDFLLMGCAHLLSMLWKGLLSSFTNFVAYWLTLMLLLRFSFFHVCRFSLNFRFLPFHGNLLF